MANAALVGRETQTTSQEGGMKTMTKTERRKLHRAVNALTPDQVAAIVRKSHPRVRDNQVDAIARRVISAAHRQVSPRRPRKTPTR
jgi:hypothetical protein